MSLYTSVKIPYYLVVRRLDAPRSQSGHFGRETTPMPYKESNHDTSGHEARSPVATPTTPPWLIQNGYENSSFKTPYSPNTSQLLIKIYSLLLSWSDSLAVV